MVAARRHAMQRCGGEQWLVCVGASASRAGGGGRRLRAAVYPSALRGSWRRKEKYCCQKYCSCQQLSVNNTTRINSSNDVLGLPAPFLHLARKLTRRQRPWTEACHKGSIYMRVCRVGCVQREGGALCAQGSETIIYVEVLKQANQPMNPICQQLRGC